MGIRSVACCSRCIHIDSWPTSAGQALVDVHKWTLDSSQYEPTASRIVTIVASSPNEKYGAKWLPLSVVKTNSVFKAARTFNCKILSGNASACIGYVYFSAVDENIHAKIGINKYVSENKVGWARGLIRQRLCLVPHPIWAFTNLAITPNVYPDLPKHYIAKTVQTAASTLDCNRTKPTLILSMVRCAKDNEVIGAPKYFIPGVSVA